MSVCEAAFNRRQALLGAGALLRAGTLTGLAPEPALAGSDETRTLTGAWHIDVVANDGSGSHQVPILYARAGGGAAISNNAPTSGSVGFGQWEHTTDREYVGAFQKFTFSPTGAPTGILRIRAISQLNEAADRMTGQATASFQPAGGSTFLSAGTTHFTGERIRT